MSPHITTRQLFLTAACAGLAASLMACTSRVAPKSAAESATLNRYVAMGSSFAAGPGIAPSADVPANRCARSRNNYAHQLARKRSLDLVDVSCSGATTAHVLGSWNELAAQIDAVTADTRLVTVAIGGNDVSYVRNLIAYSCARVLNAAARAPDQRCPTVNLPTQADWQALDVSLDRIVAGVRLRAPRARLVFVQYVSTLPTAAGCDRVPLSGAEIATMRMIARRLNAATSAAARRSKVDVIDPQRRGTDRRPCSGEPWATGFPSAGDVPFVPYHPTLIHLRPTLCSLRYSSMVNSSRRMVLSFGRPSKRWLAGTSRLVMAKFITALSAPISN